MSCLQAFIHKSSSSSLFTFAVFGLWSKYPGSSVESSNFNRGDAGRDRVRVRGFESWHRQAQSAQRDRFGSCRQLKAEQLRGNTELLILLLHPNNAQLTGCQLPSVQAEYLLGWNRSELFAEEPGVGNHCGQVRREQKHCCSLSAVWGQEYSCKYHVWTMRSILLWRLQGKLPPHERSPGPAHFGATDWRESSVAPEAQNEGVEVSRACRRELEFVLCTVQDLSVLRLRAGWTTHQSRRPTPRSHVQSPKGKNNVTQPDTPVFWASKNPALETLPTAKRKTMSPRYSFAVQLQIPTGELQSQNLPTMMNGSIPVGSRVSRLAREISKYSPHSDCHFLLHSTSFACTEQSSMSLFFSLKGRETSGWMCTSRKWLFLRGHVYLSRNSQISKVTLAFLGNKFAQQGSCPSVTVVCETSRLGGVWFLSSLSWEQVSCSS